MKNVLLLILVCMLLAFGSIISNQLFDQVNKMKVRQSEMIEVLR